MMNNRNIKKRKRRLNAKGRRKRRIRIIRRIIRLLIILLPILLICMIGSCAKNAFSKNKEDKKSEKKTEETLEASASLAANCKILSGGDVIMHGPFLKSNHYHKEDDTYDYNSIFTYITDTYESADYTVLNFESTISESDYTSYPMFRAPGGIISGLANNGVDMCILANNHIYDNFGDGLRMTQDAMDSNNLPYTGVRRTAEDDYYQIINVNDIKIGIFNYTYETPRNESGQRTINSIGVSETDIDLINTFDYNELDSFYTEISTGLEAMKAKEVDYTIAYIHWGEEYQLTEGDPQRETAQKLCDLGIDALIVGHPHVIQPVDLLSSTTGEHKMVCAYSVGNHLANQHKGRIQSAPNGHTEDGIMVQLEIDRDEEGNVALKDIQFIPTWTYRTVGVSDDSNPEYYIFPLNDPEGIVAKAQETSNMDIESQVNDSLSRTNEIIGTGVEKIKQALPISDVAIENIENETESSAE